MMMEGSTTQGPLGIGYLIGKSGVRICIQIGHFGFGCDAALVQGSGDVDVEFVELYFMRESI
jgi:hypothetical protein